MKKDICSFTYEELKEEMASIGEKSFRAGQIYDWLHVKLCGSFAEMTNLSKSLREKLEQEYEILPADMEERQISALDGTNKFLFRLYDGNMVESVLMKYKHGNSVCISSQAGCRMGCVFCASTIGGLNRNLTASEMLRQIYQIQKITGERVSNVVVMGTGEPLDNYDNLLKFIQQPDKRLCLCPCGSKAQENRAVIAVIGNEDDLYPGYREGADMAAENCPRYWRPVTHILKRRGGG